TMSEEGLGRFGVLEHAEIAHELSPETRINKVFFFQAEDGIRDLYVTGVQTCALPILEHARRHLPRMLYGFISGGVETNAARQANLDSFRDYAFIPRALVDVSRRSHGKM